MQTKCFKCPRLILPWHDNCSIYHYPDGMKYVCSECLKKDSNSQQSEALPITKLLEEENSWLKITLEWLKARNREGQIPYFISQINLLDEFIPQVRQLETESIARAKEEERQRIVGTLMEMIDRTESRDNTHFWSDSQRVILNIAIDRISNNQ